MNAFRALTSFVTVAGYEFSGPFTSTKYLEPSPGVFVVLDIAADNSWTVLDVDVLENIRREFGKHKRWGDWMKAARGRVAVGDLCSPFSTADERQALADRIRRRYRPPCGSSVTPTLTSNVEGHGHRE